MRVSAFEREQTSRRLQAACVAGYLSLDEYSERVERALAAQTRADLALLTQDLPLGADDARPRGETTRVILSSVERSGSWRVADEMAVLVTLGSYRLDFRRAVVPPLVHLEARVVLGSLDLIVPEGIDVDVQMAAVLSSKTLRLRGMPRRTEVPRLVIQGLVLAGSVTVFDVAPPHDWRA